MRRIRGPAIPAGQIAAARSLLGVDQATLAEGAGLSREYVSMLENGKQRCAGDAALKIAKYLHEKGVVLTGGHAKAIYAELGLTPKHEGEGVARVTRDDIFDRVIMPADDEDNSPPEGVEIPPSPATPVAHMVDDLSEEDLRAIERAAAVLRRVKRGA